MPTKNSSKALEIAQRKRRFANLALIALTASICAVSASAAGFSLGIIAPLCNLLPDISKEMAAFLAICGVVIILVGLWIGIKGPEVVVVFVRVAAVAAGLVGIIPLATMAFPSLSSYMCAAS